MPSRRALSWLVLSGLLGAPAATGCGDDGGASSGGGGDPPAVLIGTSDVAGDESCPTGATQVDIGLDNGDGGGTAGDAILQPGEIDETLTVCANVDGTLTSSRTLEPGEDCPLGGVEVTTGVDDGAGGEVAGDGILGPGEILETQVVCGSSESDTVTDTVVLDAGDDDCEYGGTRIDYGLDDGDGGGTADNGTLEPGEIDDAIFACNDAGEAPPNLVSRVSDLSVGDSTCPFGGSRIDYGADDGEGDGVADDGVLHADEIDGTEVACLDAESGLLVIETPVDWGDETCPTGGHIVDAGRDDGEGGATEGDGILEPSEVDATVVLCNVTIEDVFDPPPAGDPGTGIIETTGGDGEDDDGGAGGGLWVAAFTGGRPGAVVMSRAGLVDVVDAPVGPTPDVGSNALVVDESEMVVAWDGETGEAPDLFFNPTDDDAPYPIYNADGAVTGIEIEDTGTLVFDGGAFQVNADVVNDGVITVANLVEAPDLQLIAANVFIGEGGEIDLVGDDSSGSLILQAIGEAGMVVNGGALLTHEADADAAPARIYVVAYGDIVNLGSIEAYAFDGSGESGRDVDLMSYGGDIYNVGVITASGASHPAGPGGNGGPVVLTTGAVDAVDFFPHRDAFERPFAGGGSIYNVGTITSVGGDGAGDNGGRGGGVSLLAGGGNIHSSGDISLDAGAGGTGGGGRLTLEATALFNTSTFEVSWPSVIQLAGDLSLHGSSGTESGDVGGTGGKVSVVLNSTFHDADLEFDLNDLVPAEGFDVEPPGDEPIRVELLGYGDGFHLDGGPTNGTGGGARARAGLLEIAVATCPPHGSDVPSCHEGHVGAQWLYNDVAMTATGGERKMELTAGSLDGGDGVSLDASRIENHGALDLSGGSSEVVEGGKGSNLLFSAPWGAVINTADITTRAGLGCNGECDSNLSGDLTVVGFDVALSGTFDGSGPPYGWAGDLVVRGNRVALDGTFLVNGDDAFRDENATVDAGFGGDIELEAVSTLSVSGTFDLSGGTATLGEGLLGRANGGVAREFRAVGRAVDVDATITVDGGSGINGGDDDPTATSGEAGSLTISCETGVFAGTFSASAGDVETDVPPEDAEERRGGDVTLVGADIVNRAVIHVDGGDEEESDDSGESVGGDGGDIVITGNNEGDLSALGGDGVMGTPAGGGGGLIQISGDNSGCLLVTGGAPDGPAGTIEVTGTDAGACP